MAQPGDKVRAKRIDGRHDEQIMTVHRVVNGEITEVKSSEGWIFDVPNFVTIVQILEPEIPPEFQAEVEHVYDHIGDQIGDWLQHQGYKHGHIASILRHLARKLEHEAIACDEMEADEG